MAIELCEGKYKFHYNARQVLVCQRYDELWRKFCGDKAVRALFDYAEELEEALQNLYDEQNGPPLIRDQDSWQAAMDAASKLLRG